jgi:hypothetical protein
MVPILDSRSATFFLTHEKYLYGIPHDIIVDLVASAPLPQDLATASLTQNSPSRFFD